MGHCLSLWRPDGVTHAWCPNPRGLALCHLCQPQWYTLDFTTSHWGFLLRIVNIHQLTKAGFAHPAESKQNASWIKASESDEERGDLKARVNHPLVVKQLAWHEKGGFACDSGTGCKVACYIHPFNKTPNTSTLQVSCIKSRIPSDTTLSFFVQVMMVPFDFDH